MRSLLMMQISAVLELGFCMFEHFQTRRPGENKFEI